MHIHADVIMFDWWHTIAPSPPLQAAPWRPHCQRGRAHFDYNIKYNSSAGMKYV